PGLSPLSLHDALPIYGGLELGQLLMHLGLVLGLVPLGVTRPPAAPQQRDAEQEEDDAAEADPVPRLPLPGRLGRGVLHVRAVRLDRKSTRLNSSHVAI